MTSMAKFDEVLTSFEGKSPRDAYKKTCEDLGVHSQNYVLDLFPEKVGAFHIINAIELENCLLGTKGCMALLPIIRVSSTLRKINVSGCGVSDEFVKGLCEILETHPALRYVNVSDNQLITVYSAPYIINVMKHNSNLISFDVSGTHVGRNVGNIISDLGNRNVERVTNYYQDRYFKMKDLFNYLDENGTGWVHLKSLVMNCPYPVLQEQFVERIALKKPKKRSDSSISVNTFLQLVYMNYKTDIDIAQFIGESKTKTDGETKRVSVFGQSGSDVSNTEPLDEQYVLIVANWKQIIRSVEEYNRNVENGPKENIPEKSEDSMDFLCGIGVPNRRLKLPDDFHRLRLRDYLLTDNEATALISAAASEEAMKEIQENPSSGNKSSDEENGEITLSILSLLLASKTSYEDPPITKPVYQFYKERDASYIPDCVRHGSRLMSLARLSMLDSCKSSRFSMVSTNYADTVEVLSDPPRTFSLPHSVVKAVVNFFNAEVLKNTQKSKRKISTSDSPRSRRDKALERASISVSAFLSTEFSTEFEIIRSSLLGDSYARYALPIEDTTITLQEMVNVLDEMYVVLRVDRVISLEKIMQMEDPMTKFNDEKDVQPIYKEFCTKYIRDEAFLEAEAEAKRQEMIRKSII
ncbi:unnamed protein product [Phytomonas sp. Hart1]|nr:unnamed protein product [Phytomonas sp. Hart1]|eukprot:CCW65996.1 unnamed protein product [Phytomonas sp. isolate Hart1]